MDKDEQDEMAMLRRFVSEKNEALDKNHQRIAELERELKDANFWKNRHLKDRDAYALRSHRWWELVQKWKESGKISADMFDTFNQIHGCQEVKG